MHLFFHFQAKLNFLTFSYIITLRFPLYVELLGSNGIFTFTFRPNWILSFYFLLYDYTRSYLHLNFHFQAKLNTFAFAYIIILRIILKWFCREKKGWKYCARMASLLSLLGQIEHFHFLLYDYLKNYLYVFVAERKGRKYWAQMASLFSLSNCLIEYFNFFLFLVWLFEELSASLLSISVKIEHFHFFLYDYLNNYLHVFVAERKGRKYWARMASLLSLSLSLI